MIDINRRLLIWQMPYSWHEVDSTEEVTITELKSKSKINNFIYKSLLKKRTSSPIGSQEKWLRHLQFEM